MFYFVRNLQIVFNIASLDDKRFISLALYQ